MAFTFQINNDVEFIHDEKLLKKAEENRPEIRSEKVTPFRIVEIVHDPSWLNGAKAETSDKDISQLSTYGLKRDDRLILDFGDHRVGNFEIHIDQTGSPMDAPLYLRIKFAEVPAELTAESSDYDGWLSRSWIQEEFIHLDKLPASPAGAAVTRFVHKAIYGLAMGHRPGLDFKKYSLIHKIFVGGLAGVGRFIPLRLIFAMQRAAALKDRRSRGSRWYYSNYQPDYLYVTLEGSWCEAVEDAAFEDAQLMIPKGWHEVLTEVYGDYMQLPPEEKRVPTHSSQQIEIWE